MSLWDRLSDFVDDLGDRIRDLFSGGEEPPEEPPELPPNEPDFDEPDEDDRRYGPEDVDQPEDEPGGFYVGEDTRIFVDSEPHDQSEFDHSDLRRSFLDQDDAISYADEIPVSTMVFLDENSEWHVVVTYE